MPAERLMPTEESEDLIDLTRTIVAKELRPKVDETTRRAVSSRARSFARWEASAC